MHVQIVPLSWQFGELRTIWRKSTAKGSLIPWSLASIYFRKHEAAAV